MYKLISMGGGTTTCYDATIAFVLDEGGNITPAPRVGATVKGYRPDRVAWQAIPARGPAMLVSICGSLNPRGLTPSVFRRLASAKSCSWDSLVHEGVRIEFVGDATPFLGKVGVQWTRKAIAYMAEHAPGRGAMALPLWVPAHDLEAPGVHPARVIAGAPPERPGWLRGWARLGYTSPVRQRGFMVSGRFPLSMCGKAFQEYYRVVSAWTWGFRLRHHQVELAKRVRIIAGRRDGLELVLWTGCLPVTGRVTDLATGEVIKFRCRGYVRMLHLDIRD